jgi:DNA-binding NarL/FixJ family response regulator
MRATLEAEDDLTVVAEADRGDRAVTEAARIVPDLVLLRASLPPAGGAAACASIGARVPTARLVVYARKGDERALETAVRAGADGYVTLDVESARIRTALRRVLAGQAYVPPDMLRPLLRALVRPEREPGPVQRRFATLTPREREVLELLMEGCGHQAVAEILGISPATARTHIQRIIRKFGVHSRLEVTVLLAGRDASRDGG